MSLIQFIDRSAPFGFLGAGDPSIGALLGPLEPSGLGVDFVADKAIRRWAADPQTQYEGPIGGLPGLTFSRASAATRINAAGDEESVGANVLRYDHDPVTLAPRGVLLERSRTNLVVYACAIGTAPWGATAIGGVAAPTVALNDALAPDTTTTGTRIVMPAVPAGAANGSRVGISIAGLNAGIYTFSVWLKGASGGEAVYISATTNAVNYVRHLCVLTTVWQRFEITVSIPSNGATYFFQIGTDLRDAAQAATAAQTFHAWGAQLEAGLQATSLIVTGATTATRAADVLTIPTSALPFSSSEGTLFVEAMRADAGTDTGYPVAALITNAGNRIQLYTETNQKLMCYAITAEALQFNAHIGPVAAGQPWKAAVAYKHNDLALCMDGGAVVPDSTFVVPAMSTLAIGSVLGTGFNGWVRRVAYIPRRLANTELQAITS